MTTPAFLVELKAIGLRDLYHIQGFMNVLMKPRNGMPWTAEDKAAIRLHLKSVAASLPTLAVFTLPGGMLLLPLLAHFGLVSRIPFMLHPIEPALTLLRAGYGAADRADIVFGVIGSAAWCVAAFACGRAGIVRLMRDTRASGGR